MAESDTSISLDGQKNPEAHTAGLAYFIRLVRSKCAHHLNTLKPDRRELSHRHVRSEYVCSCPSDYGVRSYKSGTSRVRVSCQVISQPMQTDVAARLVRENLWHQVLKLIPVDGPVRIAPTGLKSSCDVSSGLVTLRRSGRCLSFTR